MNLEVGAEEVISALGSESCNKYEYDSENSRNWGKSSEFSNDEPRFRGRCYLCTKLLIHYPGSLSVGATLTLDFDFDTHVKTFCRFLGLAAESFERGFQKTTLCLSCQERIQLISTILTNVQQLQNRLQTLRELVVNDLKLEYYSDFDVHSTKSDTTTELTPQEFRKQLKLQLHLPQERELENFGTVIHPTEATVTADTGEFYYNRITNVKIQAPAFQANEENTIEIPEGIKIRNCSVHIEHLNLHRVEPKQRLKSVNENQIEDEVQDNVCVSDCDGNPVQDSEYHELPQLVKPQRTRRTLRNNKLEANKFQCTFVYSSGARCQLRFMDDEKITAHIKRFHMKIKSVYECNFCGLGKNSKKKLEDHVKIHTGVKDYMCDMCAKTVRNETLLLEHKRKLHGEPYPFVCDVCNKGYNTRMYLKAHQLSHTGDYMHRCSICNSGFPFASALRKHMRAHSESKYECEVCNKRMKFKGNLIRHMKVHNDQKSHVCNVCHKSFVDSAKLRIHSSIHTKERPFLCQKCGADFRIKDHLNVHLKSHERTKVIKIPNLKKSSKKSLGSGSRNSQRRTKGKLKIPSQSSEETIKAEVEEYVDEVQTDSETESETESCHVEETKQMLESIFEM